MHLFYNLGLQYMYCFTVSNFNTCNWSSNSCPDGRKTFGHFPQSIHLDIRNVGENYIWKANKDTHPQQIKKTKFQYDNDVSRLTSFSFPGAPSVRSLTSADQVLSLSVSPIAPHQFVSIKIIVTILK